MKNKKIRWGRLLKEKSFLDNTKKYAYKDIENGKGEDGEDGTCGHQQDMAASNDHDTVLVPLSRSVTQVLAHEM